MNSLPWDNLKQDKRDNILNNADRNEYVEREYYAFIEKYGVKELIECLPNFEYARFYDFLLKGVDNTSNYSHRETFAELKDLLLDQIRIMREDEIDEAILNDAANDFNEE